MPRPDSPQAGFPRRMSGIMGRPSRPSPKRLVTGAMGYLGPNFHFARGSFREFAETKAADVAETTKAGGDPRARQAVRAVPPVVTTSSTNTRGPSAVALARNIGGLRWSLDALAWLAPNIGGTRRSRLWPPVMWANCVARTAAGSIPCRSSRHKTLGIGIRVAELGMRSDIASARMRPAPSMPRYLRLWTRSRADPLWR